MKRFSVVACVGLVIVGSAGVSAQEPKDPVAQGAAAAQEARERNCSSIRRPGGAEVLTRVGSEPDRSIVANLLDVDIEIVLFLAVPREANSVPIRRDGCLDFHTGITG